jgi:hypothetical protein
MLILDLIEPHECVEGYEANIMDSEKPIDSFTREMTGRQGLPRAEELSFTDRRDPKFRRQESKPVTSTAPINILHNIKGNTPTRPEHDFADLDESGDPND